MVRPRNNLPPDSQQWSRSVENDVRQMQINASKAAQDNTNAFKALNSTMKQVSEQISTLGDQQAALTDLVAKTVVPNAFSGSGSAYAVATTYQTKASATLTTPTGFTKAVIFATAHARVLNNSGGGAVVWLTGKVNGVFGDAVFQSLAAGVVGVPTVSATGLVTGLTDGATFVVETVLFSSPALTADAGNTAKIRGIVIWFR